MKLTATLATGAGPETDPLFGANYFTLLRWALALGVVIGHAFMITTGYEVTRIHEWTLSYLSVNGFFILSGLLISKSLNTRPQLLPYIISRLLRIAPALIVLLIALILFFGPVYGEKTGFDYLTQSEPWAYVAKTLAMGDPLGRPGGVFHASSDPHFNGALWTIRYEVLAYILAGAAFFVGVLRSARSVLIAFLLVQIMYLATPVLQQQNLSIPGGVISLLRFMSTFLMGMCLWYFPVLRHPPLWSLGCSVVLFAVFGWSFLGELFANIAIALIMMRAGLVRSANARIAKIPDYSYGIYIWHFPVMQSLAITFSLTNAPTLFLIGLPFIIIVSAISWHFVEKPSLKFKVRRIE